MKMVRTLSALALSAMLVGASVLPAAAAFQQSVLDGIILIRSGAPDADGTMTYWQGTGFFVGEEGQDPQYIVTNCHVVEDFILAGKALGGGELHVLFDQDDEAEAYLVDYDADWPSPRTSAPPCPCGRRRTPCWATRYTRWAIPWRPT